MSSSHPVVPLAELCEAIVDCEHKTAPLAAHGHPSIRTTDIKNGRIDFDGANRVSEQTYRSWTQRLEPEPGDLILAREAPVGEVGIIPEGVRPCLGQRTVLLRPNSSRIVPRYLMYTLVSPGMRHALTSRAEGCTVPHLNVADIRQLPIPEPPPLPEQQRTADTLGALDDKIELNRRMNSVLESIARAIFKSWFVDFDPVRKKMEGGEVGLPPDLAALFPDSLVASAIGLIPRSWTVSEIGDELRVVGGSTPSTANATYWGGEICFATPKDLTGLSSPVLLDTDRRVTREGAATISSGVLPAGTVLMSSRAPIGYLAMTETPVCVNQGFIAMLCDQSLPSYFVLHWARSSMPLILANANGTTFPEISKRNFRPLPIVVPPRPVLNLFTQIVKPLHDCVVGNLRESRLLEAIRSALLPELLSGHLDVGGG